MNRKGYSFLDIIIGIFLLGIIVVMVLPTINACFRNLKKASERTQMIYIAENTFESLRANTVGYGDFFEELGQYGSAYFEDLDRDDLKKYKSKVYIAEENKYLWCLKIVVKKNNGEDRILNVELKGNFPKI